MKLTDAGILPYPKGNSSIRRMLGEASELGWDSCIMIGEVPLLEQEGIIALEGYLISEETTREVIAALRRAPRSASLVMVEARDRGFNRSILSTRGIHILRNLYKTPYQALDDVGARFARERGIAIDLDLSPIIHGQGIVRQRALQRYEDLLLLQRRYRFPLTLSSSARSVLDLRSVREMILLCSLFGMRPEEAMAALSTCGNLLEKRGPVEVVR
jgi:ribonuclease P/MRP protein subunit RPP1